MKNEKGMVLVLAIFMIALLSMIGLSSMMTSTTDITIAGNERFAKTVYYQAESGLTTGGEIARLFYYPNRETNLEETGFIDDNETIYLHNTNFHIGNETVDNETELWEKDKQELDEVSVDPDLQLTGNVKVDLDIDKLRTKAAPGGGALFGRGDKGGRQYIHVYNVEAVAQLPENSSIQADHVMGYHINSFE